MRGAECGADFPLEQPLYIYTYRTLTHLHPPNPYTVLSLPFLLLSRREQDIVQNQAITRAIRVEVEIGFGIIDVVPIILRVVSTIKGPEAFAKIIVNISRLARGFVLSEDKDI